MSDGALTGWVKLDRSITESPIWLCERFSKGQALADLIARANWRPSKALVGNQWRIIERGQLLTSQLALAQRWRWTRGRVRAFLDSLSENHTVAIEGSRKTRTGFTIVTIVNYHKYQVVPLSEAAASAIQVANGFKPSRNHSPAIQSSTSEEVKNKPSDVSVSDEEQQEHDSEQPFDVKAHLAIHLPWRRMAEAPTPSPAASQGPPALLAALPCPSTSEGRSSSCWQASS